MSFTTDVKNIYIQYPITYHAPLTAATFRPLTVEPDASFLEQESRKDEILRKMVEVELKKAKGEVEKSISRRKQQLESQKHFGENA
jgi:hypothetical protein